MIRIREFIHPDSVGVTVYEVEQLTFAEGRYATPTQKYWKRITPTIEPFTSRQDAEAFVAKIG